MPSDIFILSIKIAVPLEHLPYFTLQKLIILHIYRKNNLLTCLRNKPLKLRREQVTLFYEWIVNHSV